MYDSNYISSNSLQESYIQAYKSKKLDVMGACYATGVSIETVFRWARKDAEFRNACPCIIEAIHDWMDEKLMQGVMRGDIKSMILHLQLGGRFLEQVPAA